MNDNDTPSIPLFSDDGTAEAEEEELTDEERIERIRENAEEGGYLQEYEDALRELRGGETDVAKSDFRIAEIDNALFKAYEDAVWWGLEEENADLSKAPTVWDSLGELGEWIRDRLRDVLEQPDAVWPDYYDLPSTASQEIRDVLEAEMADPQGWTIGGIADRLQEVLDVDDKRARDIARNESSSVITQTREEILDERDEAEEYEYDWVGPNDHRKTDCCQYITDEIDARGGSVTRSELKDILYEAAVQHEDDGGTPARARDYQPHYNCRRTFRRIVAE